MRQRLPSPSAQHAS